jgi:hypothetical protein
MAATVFIFTRINNQFPKKKKMNKNVKYYERILKKMVEKRNGQYEEWLDPQMHAAALCWQMLEKVQEELMSSNLTEIRVGSKEQYYMEVNPLMPTYKELQRTIVLHYEALGLNYKTTPSKIKEDTKKGVDEEDPMANYYKGKQ